MRCSCRRIVRVLLQLRYTWNVCPDCELAFTFCPACSVPVLVDAACIPHPHPSAAGGGEAGAMVPVAPTKEMACPCCGHVL